MKKIHFFFLQLFCLSFLFYTSCTKEESSSTIDKVWAGKEDGISSTTNKQISGWNVKYSTVIKPIIQAKCLTGGCHAPGAGSTGYLTSYHEVALKADAPLGNGSLRKSILRQAPTPMPPSSYPKLTKSEMLQFIYWLNSGAPNN